MIYRPLQNEVARLTIPKRTANHAQQKCTVKRRNYQSEIKESIRDSVGETLNELLKAETKKLTQAVTNQQAVAKLPCGHYNR